MPVSSERAALESWPTDLTSAFQGLPEHSHWRVAVSGGCDSIFLLYCLAVLAPQSGARLSAIHLHHGLNAGADQWQAYCERVCETLSVPLITESLTLDPDASDLEARAREARYDVFEAQLGHGEPLFLAHHGDDQAETVLLRLLRGSGVRGLAGMPAERALGRGRLVRPLLGMERNRIETLAREWGLDWCEDASNRDTRFDRNYLRHEVLPVLEARWPRSGPRIARSALHCREADQLLGELAEQDAQAAASGQGISVTALRDLDEGRCQQLLRDLLIRHGCQPPGERRLRSGLDALLHAPDDGRPELRGDGYRVRRYQDRLWLMSALPEVETQASVSWQPGCRLNWFGTVLTAQSCVGKGMAVVSDDSFRVQSCVGGERFRPGPDQPHRPLRKWLQEQRIPPWERAQLPLIFCGDELVAVADLWIAPEWRVAGSQTGLQPVWHRPWQLLGAVSDRR